MPLGGELKLGYESPTLRTATNFGYQHTSGNKKAEEDADKETENRIREIKEAGDKNGDEVVESLLRAVIDAKPEVPKRFAAKSKA